MINSLKDVLPVVALPQSNGRVEITVADDMIWVSDYAVGADGKEISNFTLCIPRGPLDGAASAPREVQSKYSQPNKLSISKSGNGRSPAASAEFVRIAQELAKGPPSMAGYWFAHPTLKRHGGPVVVIDP